MRHRSQLWESRLRIASMSTVIHVLGISLPCVWETGSCCVIAYFATWRNSTSLPAADLHSDLPMSAITPEDWFTLSHCSISMHRLLLRQ
jgi:hypothetical protein